MHLLKLLFFILASFSHTVYSSYNTSVIPIRKDENTSLHRVLFDLAVPDPNQGPYLIIDLDTPYAWKDIPLTNRTEITVPCDVEEGCRDPVRCDTDLCKEAKSYINPICPTPNKTDCSMCIVTPLNPVSNACVASNLTTDLLRPYWTDGRNTIDDYPRWPFGTHFLLSTAPKSLDQSFPKNVRGVAGFSWSDLCIPRQLKSTGVTTAAKFALCLPSSSSARGVTFVGEGPFYFTTNSSVDLRSYLSYTPMDRKSSKSLGYYIKINQILIKDTPVNSVPKGGSVKMSTIVTYTTLRSDIYKALVESFSNATAGIPQVPAVEPFGLCFKDGAFGSGSVPNIDLEMERENIWSVSVENSITRVGNGSVPEIDLEMESENIWSVSIENSIKRLGNGAACLAFVDGGSKVTDPIVIGTFQMENNFLYFDLENERLGFSSSLLSRGTNCSNFNFNLVESHTYQMSSE